MISVPVTITTEGMEYRAVPDETLTRTAFVTGAIVDEATGLGMPGARVAADRPSAFSRITAGGFFCVSGETLRLFPDLATTAYSLTLTFKADHHKPRTMTVVVPIGSSFPISAGTVRLRPLPVRVEGRVTRESNRVPIGGAAIAMQAPANVVLLRTPSHMSHGLVNITPMTMTPLGPLRLLNAPAPAGALVMTLSSVAALVNGSIVRFGDPPANEYAVVQSVDAPSSTVTLRFALWRSYAKLTHVQAVNAAPAGAPVAATRETDAGEALLLLAAPLAATAVEITDAAPLREHHDTNLVADADGFFSADGIAGAATLTLRASAGGFVPLTRELSIDSSRPVADIGFRLKT